jgi:hypothetical protein
MLSLCFHALLLNMQTCFMYYVNQIDKDLTPFLCGLNNVFVRKKIGLCHMYVAKIEIHHLHFELHYSLMLGFEAWIMGC